jgi:hypothetical protein
MLKQTYCQLQGQLKDIMKHAIVLSDRSVGSMGQAWSVARIPLCLLPIAAIVSACGGGSGGGASNQVTPIVAIGQQRQYLGSATRTVVYANPTATLQNNTLEYTYVENQTVQQPAAGAPGSFDVQSSYTYTVVQDPGVGVVPISETVNTYEDLLTAGDSQQVESLGSMTATVSNDETSNALGNGPYTETSTTNATFTTPRDNPPYPLQTGTNQTVSQSETETIVFTDVNGSGAAPSNGTNVGYTITRTENDDGSFTYQQANVNGTTFSRTQNSDGSGSQTYMGATSSTDWTLGVPVMNNGVSTIPISETVNATKTTTTNYSAADWYPNNGQPSSPLVLETRNVVGPASSLPSECTGAVLRPGIYEIDTTTNSLSPWGPTYATTSTRNFAAADGASICTLTTEVQSAYSLDTGDLVSTTTTTTVLYLNSINY